MNTTFSVGQDVVLVDPIAGYDKGTEVTIVGVDVCEDGVEYYCFEGPNGDNWGGWMAGRFAPVPKPWCSECGNNVKEPCSESCKHPHNLELLEETFHPISVKDHDGKLDDGRPPVFQGVLDYFPRAILAVADVSKLGAEKYEWKGWEKVPNAEARYRDALGRHIVKRGIEGEYDADWLKDYNQKVLHDAAVAWNALAVLEMTLRGKKEDTNDS